MTDSAIAPDTVTASTASKRKRPETHVRFCKRIIDIVSMCATNVASWSEDGKRFVIRKKRRFDEFLEDVCDYTHAKLLQQLRIYGFEVSGHTGYRPSRPWEFTHKEFSRDNLNALASMKVYRKKMSIRARNSKDEDQTVPPAENLLVDKHREDREVVVIDDDDDDDTPTESPSKRLCVAESDEDQETEVEIDEPECDRQVANDKWIAESKNNDGASASKPMEPELMSLYEFDAPEFPFRPPSRNSLYGSDFDDFDEDIVISRAFGLDDDRDFKIPEDFDFFDEEELNQMDRLEMEMEFQFPLLVA